MVTEFADLQSVTDTLSHGSPEKTELFIRHYNQLLFRVGMGYLKKREDVEDAMQNTWLKAFEKLDGFRKDSKFSTWLCRIMINECLMMLRKNQKKQRMNMETEREYSQPYDAAHNMTKQQVVEWLEEALVNIPGEYRAVYIFREIEGTSTEETADLLEISVENVKVRLHRAKKMLKDELMSRVPAAELLEYHRKYCDKLTASILERILHTL